MKLKDLIQALNIYNFSYFTNVIGVKKENDKIILVIEDKKEIIDSGNEINDGIRKAKRNNEQNNKF